MHLVVSCWSAEMPPGEGPTGTAFQVAFEGPSDFFVGKGKVTREDPRPSPGRRGILARVVAGNARAQVIRESGIMAPGIGRALQEVNVVHAETLSRRTFPLDAGEALNRGMGGLGRVEFLPPPASAHPSPFSRLAVVSR